MSYWYERYRQGLHQEVYDELLTVQGHLDDPQVYQEAQLVMKAIMLRVHHNLAFELPLEDGLWEEEPILPLAPDCFFKYAYSGSGPYHMRAPFQAVDNLLLDEPHETTFVNYLRLCFQWGGFPGLEYHPVISEEQLAFLTKDFLPF